MFTKNVKKFLLLILSPMGIWTKNRSSELKYYSVDFKKEKANEKFQEIYDSNIKIIKTRAKIEPTLEIIGGIAISVVLVLAGLRILSEDSDFGSFTGFNGGLGTINSEEEIKLSAVSDPSYEPTTI